MRIGYWQSNYFPNNYWHEDYWQDYRPIYISSGFIFVGGASKTERGIVEYLVFGEREEEEELFNYYKDFFNRASD